MGHYDRERNFDDAIKAGGVTPEEVQWLKSHLNSLPNKQMSLYMEEGGTARIFLIATDNPDIFEVQGGYKTAKISLKTTASEIKSEDYF